MMVFCSLVGNIMEEIIVTDLTRFSDESKYVCLAGICTATGNLIRPLPYLTIVDSERLDIRPGTKLQGVFEPKSDLKYPHSEDHDYDEGLTAVGRVTSDEFRNVLDNSSVTTFREGFGLPVAFQEKSYSPENCPQRSIITLKVSPQLVQVVPNQYDQNKLKVHITDGEGVALRFLSITDKGFYRFAQEHHRVDQLEEINAFIHNSQEVFVRVGLGREYKGKYWLQVNGIYTFPEPFVDLRGE